ncbi:hypothetical protein HDR61_00295 [bacterium]|nr:hypothetical protein [bacterium]
MKLYKKIVPYMLLSSAALFSNHSANAQSTKDAVPEFKNSNEMIAHASYEYHTQYTIKQNRIQERAENTRVMYVENMLGAQKRLAPTLKTKGYANAVRNELPGAPVGLHCMYGQYTQLMRALNENGDTITVIPNTAKSACIAFKDQMRKKYAKPEYAGAIKEGRAFESDSAYNAALQEYLTRQGITEHSPSDKRSAATAAFAAKNFSVEHVNPGSIWIVPRFRGAKTQFHAIMFLGAGRIQAGEFVADANGRYMYTAHNLEKIGDLFKSWDMSNVFSADIEKILTVEYSKELKRLESMPRDKMIKYLTADNKIDAKELLTLTRPELIRMVQAKYFGEDITKQLSAPDNNIVNITMMQKNRV